MRTNSPAERIALNPKRQNKPVLYWEAYIGKQCVGSNNSIALLRFAWKHDKSVIFKCVR